MKNILVLNYEFPPLWWWQANANYYLFKEFAKHKEFIFTLITSSSDKYFEEVFSDNIKIIYLDIWKKWINSHNQTVKDLLVYTFKSLFKSNKLIKSNKYDLIMCWSYPAIWIWYLFKKIFNIPYISLLRWAETPFYEKKWEKLDKYIFKFLAPIFWKNSYKVIANSKWLKDLALKVSPDQKIEIIENWINLKEFNLERNTPDKIFNILYVWRLTQRKWINYLIEWFNSFSKNKDNVLLNIVWIWEDYNDLNKLVKSNKIENKVNFLGKIVHEELAKIYNQNDIFVLPSENEWMSNTLLEAMASSLPIIITDVWWTRELFDENWWIININDYNDISLKLDIAYKLWGKWELEEIWKKSFKIVKNRSWESKAKEFLNSFKI